MRSLLKVCLPLIALCLFSVTTLAAEVNCYSGKTRIYHGWGYDFVYNQYFLAFTEYKTKHLIVISGDCIVMAPVYQGDKFNAFASEETYLA
jgi:hypothetical protein